MLRDVFYFGEKPNVHPRERFAKNLADAKTKSTTEHFWIINEFCDYHNFDWDFDFEFLPNEDVWAEEHNNVWPSQHQKDSGTWLCNTDNTQPLTIYRADVEVVKRKNIKTEHWHELALIDNLAFDFSWHPDPTDPPYIYVWGNQWHSGKVMPTVEYHTDGATEKKYIENTIASLTTVPTKFDTFEEIEHFDYSWTPNPMSPPYIYAWGNQWNKPEDKISVRYVVDGATEYKYMDNNVMRKPCMDNWVVPTNVDVSEFDFSWEPSPAEPPYIYQFGTQWQRTGGPRYIVEGATDIKYMDNIKALRLPSADYWEMPEKVKIAKFDTSWHPDATESPYIYQFGTQWVLTGGPRYVMPGATEVKFIDENIAIAAQDKAPWVIPNNIDIDSFDYSWHPHPDDPPFIYQFGTQWQKTGGPVYKTPGVDNDSPVKYIDTRILKAKRVSSKKDFVTLNNLKINEFDYSWHPDTTEKPYIYIFGNNHYSAEIMPTIEYAMPGATEIKYVNDIVATLAPVTDNWEIPKDIARDDFDFGWIPNLYDPPFIYQFGTQWQKTGGPKYIASGAIAGETAIKYIDTRILKSKRLPNRNNWVIENEVNVSTFDFSWHPDDNSPKYIYQFGTISDPNDGPRYIVPGATEVINMERVEVSGDIFIDYPKYYVETTLEALVEKHKGEVFWALNSEIDYTNFDFNWRPDIQQAHYVHAFGSSESETTQTYFINSNMWMNGYRELNWVKDEKLDEQTLAKLFKKPDMFFVDKGNSESQARFEKLKAKFDNIQKTRYLNTWVDTINRCINRSTTNLCWILNSELEYDNFDFNYYPNPWQMKMVHVFGTQWSHWGTTFMVNRDNFAEDTKYIKIIEHLSCLNFVKERRAVATNRLYDVVYIDHGNDVMFEAGSTVIKYEDSYLATFKKLLAQLPEKKEHYIWVCSSICDYQGFDFTYICDPFAREQLHVFPSDKQKFGDTFLVNVNKLRELISDMSQLEDYTKINYNQHQRVKRLPAPTIITNGDTHASSIDIDYNFPYAEYVTVDNKDVQCIDTEPMSLWSEEHKKIMITTVGGTRIIAPKEIKDHVKRELYDYPYIITNSKLAQSKPLDIVFLSNGEKGADENYEHLLNVTKGLKNKVIRVDGVNGRVQSYHAAAEASETPWMFTVFAKLKVSLKFDWNWQPDRLQIPKHYVFHAKNPVNGLVYGHQAMIAYNKKLTLANEGKGLDFTMDDEHEIVEIVSGTANFNTDEWTTWRTSFREALKLRANTDDVSKNRLEFWLTVGSGKFSQYSIDGATDAVEYYESVNGDFEKLKLSYDWPWLKEYFNNKYN